MRLFGNGLLRGYMGAGIYEEAKGHGFASGKL